MPDDDDTVARLRAELADAKSALDQERAQRAALTGAFTKLAERAGPQQAPGRTVQEIYDRFEKAYCKRPCWKVARNKLRAFMAVFGADQVSDINPARWGAFRDQRKTEKPLQGKRETISALTVNFELDWVKRMFNWAMEPEQGLIPVNPLALAKREKTRHKRETWITEDDLQVTLSAIPRAHPRNERVQMLAFAFLLNLADTGLRFNEMRRLRRDRCRVRPDGSVVADVGRTKNGNPHLIAFTARGWAALEAIIEVLGSPYYFANPSRRGALFNDRTMRGWCRRIFETAGLDAKVADGDFRFRVHDIRHTAASAADRRGASLRAIQEMLGHSNPGITVRYIHRSEDSAVALARLMEKGAREEAAAAEDRRRKNPHRAPGHVVTDGESPALGKK